jgi:alpha-1,3-rhamnosyl/mannosyltransferase
MKNKPITVLFDANPIAQSGKSGVGYYVYRLIDALAKNYPDDLKLVGHYYDFLGRKGNPDLPQYPNLSYRTTKLLPGKVFNGLRRKLHIETPLELLARTRGDVLLFPNFALSPSLYGKPRIGAIHDLYYLDRPDHIQAKNLDFLRQYVPKTARQADLILTVSNFSKQRLAKEFAVDPNKILVTHVPPHPQKPMAKPAAEKVLGKMKITKKFILAVGTLEPRKNFTQLIAAYGLLDESLRQEYSLIIVGGGGWNNMDLLAAADNAQKQGLDVIMPGYVTEEQKAALYARTETVVVPSLYEGFGMQLLEAMEVGTPVVASDIPVFHEVAGKAAEYVNPNSPQSIADGITKVLTDKKLHKQLVAKGHKQLGTYSWDAIAADVYKGIKGLYRG